MNQESPPDAAVVDGPDEILSERRRRYLLYCLYMYSNPVLLPDIAHQITIWEAPDDHAVGLQQRLQTYMSLYHDHVPAMIDAGVVEYDQQEDMVERGPAADRIEQQLASSLQNEIDELLRAESGEA